MDPGSGVSRGSGCSLLAVEGGRAELLMNQGWPYHHFVIIITKASKEGGKNDRLVAKCKYTLQV